MIGDLDEEDDGHPLGRAGQGLSGHQTHVDGARKHDEADEQRPPDSLPSEAVPVLVLLEQDRRDFLFELRFRHSTTPH